MDTIERKALAGTLSTLALLVALAVATYAGTSDFITRSRELNRIHQVLGKLDLVFKHLGAARGYEQAYLRRAQRSDLNACQNALLNVDQLFAEIHALSTRQAGQIERLGQLGPLLADQINLVSRAIRGERSTRGFAAAAKGMAALHRLLEDFKARETALMADHSAAFEQRARRLKWVLGGSLALSALIFALVHWFIHLEMGRRLGAEAALQSQTRMLATVLRDMSDAVLVFGADGRLSASNPAAERIFGELPPRLDPHDYGPERDLLLEDRQTPLPFGERPEVRSLQGHDCDGVVVCARRATDQRLFVLSATARCSRDQDGRINGAMVTFHDITQLKSEELALHGAKRHLEERVSALKEAQVALQEVAVRDPLTGLFNRRQLDKVFAEELARARHAGISLGVVMCDIDHFKAVNDTFGHDAGDLVLKEVSAALKASLRSNDSLFRFGGEEFTLLLPGADLREAQRVAEKARLNVSRLVLAPQGRSLGRLSVSLGIAAFAETAQDAATLLRQADAALYASKHNGRDRSTLWQEGTPHAA